MFLTFLDSIKTKWGLWFKERAHGTYAKAWLVLLSFSEASFFVVPPDVLLIAILMVGSSRWVFYATLTTITSVVGGVFGYLIGFLFFDAVGVRIIEFYHLSEQMKEIQLLYNNNAFWVIFTAAFTPIPYKLFTLSAGFFKINIIAFVIASVFGRGLRYFLVAYITKLFGGKITRLLLKYFNIITVIVVTSLVAIILLSMFATS